MNDFVKKWVEENYPDAYRTHDGISVEDIVTDFSAALVAKIKEELDDIPYYVLTLAKDETYEKGWNDSIDEHKQILSKFK